LPIPRPYLPHLPDLPDLPHPAFSRFFAQSAPQRRISPL
jgi:hypothetical protein